MFKVDDALEYCYIQIKEYATELLASLRMNENLCAIMGEINFVHEYDRNKDSDKIRPENSYQERFIMNLIISAEF